MNVDELIVWCEKQKAEGNGAARVIWQSIHHTWDITPALTTRNGTPVVLVNP